MVLFRITQSALHVVPKGARGIAGKILRSSLNWPSLPKPFPWETKPYMLWHRILQDRTSYRLNDNSKVIVVDGPIAAGKTRFAKELAEDLDMRHFPEITLDAHYIDSYGFDMRTLDPKLPFSCRSYDHKDFCMTPKHLNTANFQIMMYRYRFSQYLDGLAHVLNTGQGVVMERSPYSDYVFAEAMKECGYISKPALEAYNAVKLNTLLELARPHLVIYLDAPTDIVKQRVKERKLPYEVNSEIISDKYLNALERGFKLKYLKEAERYSEVLVYNWAIPADVEVVVEDIERIDFENFHMYSDKFKDWHFFSEQQLDDMRQEYTNNKPEIMNGMNVPLYHVPELVISADDAFERNKVYETVPSMQYIPGYNKSLGDSGLLFKNKLPFREGFLHT